MSKAKTNSQIAKDLLKELSSTPYEIGVVILRERLDVIARMTEESIAKNPEAWTNNPLVSPKMYLEWCEIVKRHCNLSS
jgi:hypothetical protein